ncbi:hypothetical protein KAH81_00685 [bacterium]|nr:hypothetical protein [bacterium]
MKTMRKFWGTIAIAIAILAFTGSAIAQTAVMETRETRTETSPIIDREDVTPLDSRPATPVMTPAETAPLMRTLSDGHGPAPIIPGEAMDVDSRDIYIYVTLLAPIGPDPPDTVKIISKNCTDGNEAVEFKTDLGPTGYYGDFFNVYRDTLPLFFMTQLDTTPANRNLIGRTVIRFFTDDFEGTTELPDTLWQHYEGMSKGVCDTLINLFYAFTTVDTGASAPDGYSESSFPSWCMCEYDQSFYYHLTYGNTNFWSVPNADERFVNCSDLDPMGIRQIMEWDAVSQVPVVIAYKHSLFGWTDAPLMVGHVYEVSGDYAAIDARDDEYEYFQTYTPGIIPETDSVFTLAYSPIYGGRNIIMLPFKASIVEGITDRVTLEVSIEEAGSAHGIELKRIDVWNGSSFVWTQIAYEHSLFGWSENPHLRPGKVYYIYLETTSGTVSFTWPIT